MAVEAIKRECDAQTGSEPIPAHPFVEMNDVNLIYHGDGSDLTLQSVSLTVRKGEFVAVVGPSGCGKSTLMKLVTGLVPPSAGSITVDGKAVSGPVAGVGMAFQNSTLMPWRTTLDNTMLPLEIAQPFKREHRKKYAEHTDLARRILASVGLLEYSDKYPWQLSGGMQQRANLCRALIHQPRLLMLDEPFGALDAFTREELWLLLQNLWLEQRFSTILVTHDLREAVFLADTIYVMSKRPGRILQRRSIRLPRPRTIGMTFDREFGDTVQELREKIIEARS